MKENIDDINFGSCRKSDSTQLEKGLSRQLALVSRFLTACHSRRLFLCFHVWYGLKRDVSEHLSLIQLFESKIVFISGFYAVGLYQYKHSRLFKTKCIWFWEQQMRSSKHHVFSTIIYSNYETFPWIVCRLVIFNEYILYPDAAE